MSSPRCARGNPEGRRALVADTRTKLASAVEAVADFGAVALGNFVFNVVLARNLGAATYGAFALAFAVHVGFSFLHSAFVTEPLLVLMKRQFTGREDEYLSEVLVLNNVLWCVVGALLCAVACLPAVSPAVRPALIGAGVSTPFLLLYQLLRRVCYARHAVGRATLGGLAYSVLLLAGTWWLAATHRVTIVNGFALLSSVSLVVSMAWWKTAAASRSPRRGGVRREVVLAHWSYARFSLVGIVTAWAQLHCWYLVLPQFDPAAGTIASGRLRAVMNLTQPMILLNAALAVWSMPRFADALSRDPGHTPWATVRALAAIAGLFAVVLVGLGPRLLRGLYGDAGGVTLDVVLLLALVPLFHALFAVTRSFALARANPALPMRASMLGAVAALLVGLPLCAQTPLRGAAAGMLAGSTVQALWLIWSIAGGAPSPPLTPPRAERPEPHR